MTLFFVIAASTACSAKRDDEPLAECTAYVRRLESCFGEEASDAAKGAYEKPPKDESAREAMRARCSKQDVLLRSACH